MNYKEKYEKALAMAKDIHDGNPSSSTAITVCEQIFPELAKSEDEKIRQFLIHEVTETSDEIMSYRNINKKDVLVWLEKQGEQNKQEKDCYLWHDESEKCLDKKAYILFHSTYDNTWNVFTAGTINWNVVDKWAYLSDIINIVNKDSKQSEKKPAWNEEDEKMSGFIEYAITLDDASMYLKSNGIQVVDAHLWLDELKERVQTKQEWSKEDEKEVAVLEAYIRSNDWSERHINRALGIIDELVKKLKSLRPQSTWKPSDEQMGALANACDGKMLNLDYLNSLYQDLKKLKGE